MRKLAVLLLGGGVAISAQGAVVGVGDSTSPWLGFMNVFELPSNGGGYVFSSIWGVPDLRATFNDPGSTLTLYPNSVGDPNPFWYQGGGGPGAPGNKIMEANLYVETTDVFNGQTLTFQGNVLSDTFTSSHQAYVFIKDFAPDYSSVNQILVPLAPGPFSINLATNPGAGRHVQYGFQVVGVNVWITDIEPFGNVVIGTIPTPGATGVLVAGGVLALRRRRQA